MNEADPIDLRLEISSIEEPISGRLRDEQGRTAEFRGWIELSAAISRLAEGTEINPITTTQGAISND